MEQIFGFTAASAPGAAPIEARKRERAARALLVARPRGRASTTCRSSCRRISLVSIKTHARQYPAGHVSPNAPALPAVPPITLVAYCPWLHRHGYCVKIGYVTQLHRADGGRYPPSGRLRQWIRGGSARDAFTDPSDCRSGGDRVVGVGRGDGTRCHPRGF